MSNDDLKKTAQSNLSSEYLADIQMNPESTTSGFVESNPFPGQDVYDLLTNQPFNSQPLQSQVPSVPQVPGLSPGESMEAWTNKQNDNILKKLNQAQSWGYDEYKDLKPYTFGTGAKHTNFDRYYNHPKFDELGFTPFRDNETLYNENSSILDDYQRAIGQWGNIFATTIKSSYESLGDMFTGDFLSPGSRETAFEFEDAMNIGYSSRGGIMGGFNNLLMQSAIPVAMGIDFLATEFLLGLTGNVPGMGAKAAQTGASIGRMSKLLSNAPKLKNFYNGARQAGKSTTSFFLPNTVKNLAEYGQGTNKLANFANVTGSFADFFKDIRNMNYALSESKLEGGLVKNQLANDLIYEYIEEYGENPDDKTMARIYDHAQDAGFTTTAINFPIIFASNKIIMGNLFNPGKIGARSALEVIDAGLKNGKKLVYDAAKASTGKAFTEVGMVGAAKAGIKALARPSTYLRGGLNYFKANISEGLQEVAQEITSGASYDYYKRIYEDPSMGGAEYAMGDTLTNIKKQMSAEGFEVFASGFFMGGLMNVMGAGVRGIRGAGSKALDQYYKAKNPENYKNAYEANKAKNAEVIQSLNDLYQDPMQYFSPDRETLVESFRLNKGLNNAANRGDEKEFIDFSDIAKFQGVYNALSLNRFDPFINMLKDMRQLEGSEIKEALKLDKNLTDEEARLVLDKGIQRAEKIKSNYDSLSQYKNPFNPERFSKKNINKDADLKEQYEAEVFSYLGFEEAKKRAVFSIYGFDRAKERMKSISENLSSNPAVANAAFSDVLPLLSQTGLAEERERLKAEIASLKEATDDYNIKLKADKEKKLKALDEISKAFTDNKQLELFINPEVKKLYEDYFKTIADVSNSFYEKNKVEQAIKDINDYYQLEQDANRYSNDVNTLLNPDSFYKLAAREAGVRKKLYEERQKAIDKAIEKFESLKGDNEFLNLLYDANIAIDPAFLDLLGEQDAQTIVSFIESIEEIRFIDIPTSKVFSKKDTEEYAKVQEVIDDWKARRPKGEETETEVETETETETEVDTEVDTEEIPTTTLDGKLIPTITNFTEFGKLPKALRATLTSANAQYNSEMGNEEEDITRPYQFAGMKRGKKIIADFFTNPENKDAVDKYYEDQVKTDKPDTSIPLTITSQIRQQLYDLGYNKEDVDAMKPETAQDIIANQTTKPKEASAEPSTIEAKRADIERRRQEELNNKQKFVSSKKRQEKGEGEFKAITVEDIDLEASGLEGIPSDANVIVLEERGLNPKGKKVGTVRIITKEGAETFEVFFNTDKINAKYDAELAALEDTDTETTVDETVVDDYTIQSEDQLREYSELDQEYEGDLAAFEEEEFGSSIEYRIGQLLGNFKVPKEDVVRYAGKGIFEGEEGGKRSRQYTRKDKEKTRTIDDLAFEASDDETEVTIQDIVDFIEKYPAGVGNKNSKSRDSFYGYHNPKLNPKYNNIAEIKKALKDYYSSQVKPIRSELVGKVVYVTPGSGKTTAAAQSEDIIDGDDLLLDEVRTLPQYTDARKEDLPGILAEITDIDTGNKENADRVYNNALAKAKELAAEGKTVLFGSRRFIPQVDVVITSLNNKENNDRIVQKFVSAGQQIANAQTSVNRLRTRERQKKDKTVINTPFDEYIFGAEAAIPEVSTKLQERFNERVQKAITLAELETIYNEYLDQINALSEINTDEAAAFDKLYNEKKKSIKEILNFDNVQKGNILMLKDGSKNALVTKTTKDYIEIQQPGKKPSKIPRSSFENIVDMVYNGEIENPEDRITGLKEVPETTTEDKENIQKNQEEYFDFTSNRDAINEASKEADNQSAEDVDNEFFDDLGCK